MADLTLLTNKIFLNAALPLVKVIANDVPSLAKKFKNVHAVIQVSALDSSMPAGKAATHFVVNAGEWQVHADKVSSRVHVELQFKSREAMNAFFKGKISPATLPKMIGVTKNLKAFVAFMSVLLKMSSLLAQLSRLKQLRRKGCLSRLLYLLSNGISQLNKNGHEAVHNWALKSPDRVYA